MESTTVLLVRHGQTPSNVAGRYMGWIDEDLSEEGVWQVEQLSCRLESRSIIAAYSSPLRRARRTAEIIAAPHSIPVSIVDGLGEIRIGAWEGKFGREIEAEFPDIWRLWKTDPSNVQMPGGESLPEVQLRAIDTLERITQSYQSESTLLLCCHNFVNLTILCYALEVPLDRFREIRQDTAALNILYMKGKRLKAEVVNERSHLQRLKEKMTD